MNINILLDIRTKNKAERNYNETKKKKQHSKQQDQFTVNEFISFDSILFETIFPSIFFLFYSSFDAFAILGLDFLFSFRDRLLISR